MTDRFRDQFNPMLIGHNMSWPSSDSTIIRMPLSSECFELGSRRIKQISDRFMEHSSRSLIFLKSVMQVLLMFNFSVYVAINHSTLLHNTFIYDQVSISTWEEGNPQPCEDCSVSIDLSSAIMRNPFSEKKWRKFQISRLFNSSNAATKLHVIDVHLNNGTARVVDRWLVALSLGSGQTRNMALDRYVMEESGY